MIGDDDVICPVILYPECTVRQIFRNKTEYTGSAKLIISGFAKKDKFIFTFKDTIAEIDTEVHLKDFFSILYNMYFQLLIKISEYNLISVI